MFGTSTGDGSAAPAAFLLAGARLVGERASDPDDVGDEVAALVTVLDELVRARVQELPHLPRQRGPEGATSPSPSAAALAPDVTATARRLEGGWQVLGPRTWPGSHRRDLELVLVGPGGVLVGVGVGWVNLRVAGGHLWRGPECADVVLDAVSADADAVRRVLAEVGLAPAEVTPLALATGADPQPAVVRGVAVVGLARLASMLVRRGGRLEPPSVQAVGDALRRACPARGRQPLGSGGTGGTGGTGAGAEEHRLPQLGLAALAPLAATENDRVQRALDDVLSTPAAPAWATWLHPEQARAAGRPLPGPALLTGPSGTGKTVVALHRARVAAASGRRVLLTSPVRGVAQADRAVARRMAGWGWDGVDFLGLPAVAARILGDARGDGGPGPSGVAGPAGSEGAPVAADACWAQAWAEVGPPPGAGLPTERFWREEVTAVLGRGLEAEQDHADWCDSRPVMLPEPVRARVWELAEAYRHALREAGALDEEELFRLARARLAVPHRPLWDAVVVDDAQDVTWAGLQLVLALAGARPEALLLVSDPDQACSRACATLGEAGLDLADRVLSLRQDHRCADQVLTAAHALMRSGDARGRLVAVAHPRRAGGQVVSAQARDDAEREALLVQALRDHVPSGGRPDQAVLVADDEAVARWLSVLTAAGLPCTDLADGGGHPGGRRDVAVRVGTPERARGRDFAHVLLPDPDAFDPSPGLGPRSGDAVVESLRAAGRRRRHAAATRARDLLWLCRTGDAPPQEV
ncbi:MAG: AAA family ATPase [Kineosporiaceae bacterium]